MVHLHSKTNKITVKLDFWSKMGLLKINADPNLHIHLEYNVEKGTKIETIVNQINDQLLEDNLFAIGKRLDSLVSINEYQICFLDNFIIKRDNIYKRYISNNIVGEYIFEEATLDLEVEERIKAEVKVVTDSSIFKETLVLNGLRLFDLKDKYDIPYLVCTFEVDGQRYPQDTYLKDIYKGKSLVVDIKEKIEYQIFVKNIFGKSLTFNIKYNDTIYKLKQQIEGKEGIPPDQQRLIFGGKQLEDHKTIVESGIGIESMIFLVLRLRGGMHHYTSGRNDYEVAEEKDQISIKTFEVDGIKRRISYKVGMTKIQILNLLRS